MFELLLGAVSEMVKGALGAGGEALSVAQLRKLQNSFQQLRPDANHDLLRAAQTAYWQAVSQLLGERATQLSLPPEDLLKRKLVAQAIAHAGSLSQTALSGTGGGVGVGSAKQWADYLRSLLKEARKLRQGPPSLSIAPAAGEAALREIEQEWLEQALLQCWALIADIQAGSDPLPAETEDPQFEQLLLREGQTASDVIKQLRERLTGQMQADFVARLGEPSEPMRALIEEKWFEYYRGAFHVFVKTDDKVVNILLSETLVKVLFETRLSAKELRDRLDQLDTNLTAGLHTISQQLAQFPDLLKMVLAPLLASYQRIEQHAAALPSIARNTLDIKHLLEQFLRQFSVKADDGIPRAVEVAYLKMLLKYFERISRYVEMSGEAPLHQIEQICEFANLVDDFRVRTKPMKPFTNAVKVMRNRRRVALLGEPGGGKTTTLAKLARELAEEALLDPHKAIPLWIPLGFWNEADESLEDFMARVPELMFRAIADEETAEAEADFDLGLYLKELREQKRSALLLDGLNELPVEQRGQKYSEVVAVINHWKKFNPKLLAFVTCRKDDYQEAKFPFGSILIKPFDAKQIREFTNLYLPDGNGETLFWRLAGERVQNFHRDFLENVGSQHETAFWRAETLPFNTRWVNRWRFNDDEQDDRDSRWRD